MHTMPAATYSNTAFAAVMAGPQGQLMQESSDHSPKGHSGELTTPSDLELVLQQLKDMQSEVWK